MCEEYRLDEPTDIERPKFALFFVAIAVGVPLLADVTVSQLSGEAVSVAARWVYSEFAPAVTWAWSIVFVPLGAMFAASVSAREQRRASPFVAMAFWCICLASSTLAVSAFVVPASDLVREASPPMLAVVAVVIALTSVYALRVVSLPSLKDLRSRYEARARSALRVASSFHRSTARRAIAASVANVVLFAILTILVIPPAEAWQVDLAALVLVGLVAPFTAFFAVLGFRLPRRDGSSRASTVPLRAVAVFMGLYGLLALADVAFRVSPSWAQFGSYMLLSIAASIWGASDRWYRTYPLSFGAVASSITAGIYGRIAERNRSDEGCVAVSIEERERALAPTESMSKPRESMSG